MGVKIIEKRDEPPENAPITELPNQSDKHPTECGCKWINWRKSSRLNEEQENGETEWVLEEGYSCMTEAESEALKAMNGLICQYCGEEFDSRRGRNIHIGKKHQNEESGPKSVFEDAIQTT